MIRAFDDNPNGRPTEFSIFDAVMYQGLSQTGNYLVKGFIVGQAKMLSVYNASCNEPDFNVQIMYNPCMNMMNFAYAFVERLELDPSSCRRENAQISIVAMVSGYGRTTSQKYGGHGDIASMLTNLAAVIG